MKFRKLDKSLRLALTAIHIRIKSSYHTRKKAILAKTRWIWAHYESQKCFKKYSMQNMYYPCLCLLLNKPELIMTEIHSSITNTYWPQTINCPLFTIKMVKLKWYIHKVVNNKLAKYTSLVPQVCLLFILTLT